MKAAGLYLFVALIPTLVNSCLVVKSPPCTCVITVLDRTNIDQMAGQPWYDYVVQRPLTTPSTIRYFENNCAAFIQCPRPYTLYAAEYLNVNAQFKPDQVAYCDQKTNTWNISIVDRTYQSTKWFPICVDETKEELCTPKTNTTFLFAYSNDMDSTKVQEMIEYLQSFDEFRSLHFTTLSHIRFDVLQEETIEYHKNYEEWLTAMGSKLPDPSLGFTSRDAGSDVLKVISKFINNTQVPICGSRIYILLKRSPNEQDITELVAQMKKYRVYVYIASSSIPSGGSHPQTTRRLTTLTNGLDYYYEDSSFDPWIPFYTPFFLEVDLIYAANVNLSPNGSIALPKLTFPRHETVTYIVTHQRMEFDVPPLNLKLTNGNRTVNKDITFPNYDNLINGDILLNAAVYEMKLDYVFTDDVVYAVQVRIITSRTNPYWIPYDD